MMYRCWSDDDIIMMYKQYRAAFLGLFFGIILLSGSIPLNSFAVNGTVDGAIINDNSTAAASTVTTTNSTANTVTTTNSTAAANIVTDTLTNKTKITTDNSTITNSTVTLKDNTNLQNSTKTIIPITVNNATISTDKQIEIGKSVHWTQVITLNDTSDGIAVEIPDDAKHVTVTSKNQTISQRDVSVIPSSQISSIMMEKTTNSTGMDMILIDDKESSLIPLGDITPVEEDKDTKIVVVSENIQELTIQYDTPAPYTIEKETDGDDSYEKKVKVKSDSAIHYENVRSYSTIPEEYVIQGIPFELDWLINGTRVNVIDDDSFDVQFDDTDGNGLVDMMSWIVPQLSEKVFSINADTSEAETVGDVSSKLQQMQVKLDGPFYDKTLEMVNAKVMGKLDEYLIKDRELDEVQTDYESLEYYDVIILPNLDGYEKDDDVKEAIKQNQQKIKNNLELKHDAKNVFAAERLSFVTAQIPVSEIGKLSEYGNVKIVGDGELGLELELNVSKDVVNSEGIELEGIILRGDDVLVSVIDSGINHRDLNNKIVKSSICDTNECVNNSELSVLTNHGTHVAGIISGYGGLSANNEPSGIAINSNLLNVRYASETEFTVAQLAQALERSIQQGAQIINISSTVEGSVECKNKVPNLLVDEVVDEGINVITSAGNSGGNGYRSITDIACGFNVISVGNLDDKDTPRLSDDVIYKGIVILDTGEELRRDSSIGPTKQIVERIGEDDLNTEYIGNRLKPEIVAPGTDIISPHNGYSGIDDDFFNNQYDVATGTSFAAPHVTGAAAILLQARPEYTPLEVKSALLLGASWNNRINPILPLTANTYEGATSNAIAGNPNPESFRDHEKLNEWGFGLLDVKASVDYATKNDDGFDDTQYIIRDHFRSGDVIDPIDYTFNATANKPVRIILSWLIHPTLNGFTVDNATNIQSQTPSNMELLLAKTGQAPSLFSASNIQNNEFIVFNPAEDVQYTVTVAPSFPIANRGAVETFVISATEEMKRITHDTNHSPTGQVINNINVTPGEKINITLSGDDEDGDEVTFYIMTDPTEGNLGSIRYLHDSFSATVDYTAKSDFNGETFSVIPYDGRESGAPFQVRINLANSPTNTDVTLNSDDTVDESYNVSFTTDMPEIRTVPLPGSNDVTAVALWDDIPFLKSFLAMAQSSDVTPVTAIKPSVTAVNGAVLEYMIDSTVYREFIPPDSNKLIEFSDPKILQDVKISKHNSNQGSATVGYIIGTIIPGENLPPNADAGSDQTVTSGNIVSLNAGDSSDPEGEGSLRHTWRQTSGNLVVLSSASNGAVYSFTAPDVSSQVTLVFEVTVKDIHSATDTDTVTITIKPQTTQNDPPIARAGPNQTVNERILVTLNARGSSDLDGDTLTFSWEQNSGPTVTLSDITSPIPTFTAPDVSVRTDLNFEVTVSDGISSRSDIVSVTVNDVPVIDVNQPPTANAGADQTINEFTVAFLDARDSSDPDFDTITYSWVQTAGPAVTITNPTSALASFTSPSVSADILLTFTLSVSDGELSDSDTVTIIIQDNSDMEGIDAIINPDLELDDDFGDSIDVFGDRYLIVGVPRDNHSITVTDSGSAYLYDIQGDTPILLHHIPNPQPDSSDGFGFAVAGALVNNNPVAIVGAYRDDPDGNRDSGSVYLFDGTNGNLIRHIPDPGATRSDNFGFSVAVTGDDTTIIVGAPGDGTSASRAGSVYLFSSSTGNILQHIPNPDPDGGASDDFGVSVAGFGTNKILVGAPDYDISGMRDVGVVYVLDDTGDVLHRIDNPNPITRANMGEAISSIGDGTILVGVPDYDLGSAYDIGTSYAFGPTGAFLFEMSNPTPQNDDEFGISISGVGTNQILVGAPGDTFNHGSVYVYDVMDGRLISDFANPHDASGEFGKSVASVGDTVLAVSAPMDNRPSGGATGTVFLIDADTAIPPNSPPIAFAGSDQNVDEGDTVTLDGKGSTDPDNDNLTYSWSQVSGDAVTLSDVTSTSPTFTAPQTSVNTTLRFSLTVHDGMIPSSADIVNVTVQDTTPPNNQPIAFAGNDIVINETTIVTLDGTGSMDPDNDTITYLWSQTSGNAVVLSNVTITSPTFTAPEVSADTILSFSLIVNDGMIPSSADIVNVTVQDTTPPNNQPIAFAGSDQNVDEGDSVTLDGTGSSDPDNDNLTYSWSQVSGDIIILSNTTVPSPSFTAPQVTEDNIVLTFSLTVHDGIISSETDVVTITVSPLSICGADITTSTSIPFGEILPGETSEEYTMSIQNTGNLLGTISMSGNNWTDENDGTIMTADVTKYSILSNDYSSKTHLSQTQQDVLVLGLNETKGIFLQLQADLIDSLFSGGLEQTIEVNLAC